MSTFHFVNENQPDDSYDIEAPSEEEAAIILLETLGYVLARVESETLYFEEEEEAEFTELLEEIEHNPFGEEWEEN